MRYALVSDIHANLQAWNATLLDIRSSEIDHIICLGDLVGYGPNPVEVLQSVHASVDDIILGNHDAVIAGLMDPSLFNEKARAIIDWTAAQLGKPAVQFLKGLPLSLAGDGFRCTHGDFSSPASFRYVIDAEDAVPSWHTAADNILFVGHTHQPRIFILQPNGAVEVREPEDVTFEPGLRHLVNVGSVGQPRDGEARACYAILDTKQLTLSWRRIPFDIDAYRAALQTAGLPESASYFLVHDPRKGRPPLREILNFSPAQRPEQGARNAVELRELKELRRSMRKWKYLSLGILAIALAVAAAIGFPWWQERTRGLDVPAPDAPPVVAAAALADANLLAVPPTAGSANEPIRGWSIHLSDRRRQAVRPVRLADKSAQPPEPTPALSLSSSLLNDPLRISADPVTVSPDMRLTLEGSFLKSRGWTGSVEVVVMAASTLSTPETQQTTLLAQAPNIREKGGWFGVKKTLTVPPGMTVLRVHIRGAFLGEVVCRDLRLQRKTSLPPHSTKSGATE